MVVFVGKFCCLFIVVILGFIGIGKFKLVIEIGKRVGGEIFSVDLM